MKRVRIPEEMDDPCLDAAAHNHALNSLAQANRMLGVDFAITRSLRVSVPGTGPILDLGCGRGAILQCLADARSCKAVGVDRSEFALKLAAKNFPSGSWVVADVRQLPLASRSFDVVVCTLLLHHFDSDDVVDVLSEAAPVARVAVLISDLTRSRLAWLCTWLGTRLLSRSWVFHIDGPRSVRAAYTPSELQSLAARANIQGADITWQFPFRMLLVWFKPGAGTGADHAL